MCVRVCVKRVHVAEVVPGGVCRQASPLSLGPCGDPSVPAERGWPRPVLPPTPHCTPAPGAPAAAQPTPLCAPSLVRPVFGTPFPFGFLFFGGGGFGLHHLLVHTLSGYSHFSLATRLDLLLRFLPPSPPRLRSNPCWLGMLTLTHTYTHSLTHTHVNLRDIKSPLCLFGLGSTQLLCC